MTIKVGDTIPSMKLMVATTEGPKEISTDDIFKGKKVVLEWHNPEVMELRVYRRGPGTTEGDGRS